MRLIFALCLIAAPVGAETCPPAPDLGGEMEALFDQARKAPDARSAQPVANAMWELWAKAPDPHAQELLDAGMERRGAYDFDAAVKAFDALVAYCPEYAEGYNQRAFISFIREDFEQALADLNRAIELSPSHVAALSGKALTLMGLKRDAEAQRVLRDALALNPWIPERGLLRDIPGTDL